MPTPTRRTIRRTPTGGAGPRAAGDSVTIDLSHAPHRPAHRPLAATQEAGRTAREDGNRLADRLASPLRAPGGSEGEARARPLEGGDENQNHWRRDSCLQEDLKTYRGKRPNICAALLLGRSVLLALNADWGSGNLNALLETLRASTPAIWSLTVRCKTTCRGLAHRAPSRPPLCQMPWGGPEENRG